MNTPRRSALIVDDDPVALIVLQHMLESQGFSVVAEATVTAARRQLETTTFDVLFVDYVLPGETGLDLLEYSGDVPVVLLTGYRSQSDLDDPRASEVVEYLTKPVSTQDLASVITDLFDASAVK